MHFLLSSAFFIASTLNLSAPFAIYTRLQAWLPATTMTPMSRSRCPNWPLTIPCAPFSLPPLVKSQKKQTSPCK
ncbi:hypothetical protein F5Y16DRAFT_381482 [Xylariaceae sp. FL0255]|nr:hypothetical protein F5Y16DRAFT_381482 [Xylariaceae sp. FL0255]